MTDLINTAIGGGFNNILQFLNSFLLAAFAIQIHRVLYFHSKKSFEYQFEKKRLYQYFAWCLSFLSVEFLFAASREGLFSWYNGKENEILMDMAYYLQNSILVFVLVWYITFLIYHIINVRADLTCEKKAFRHVFYLREVVFAGICRIGIMILLPILFYLIMINDDYKEVRSLSYNGLLASDFWKIFWLPFAIEVFIFVTQIIISIAKSKKFNRSLYRNGRGRICSPKKHGTVMIKYMLIPLVLHIMVASFVYVELKYGKELILSNEAENENKYLYTDEFKYYYDDNKIIIDKYTSENKLVEIPTTIDGKVVYKIAYKCFSDSEIEKVIIPDSIEYIDSYVFSNCSALEAVILPKNLTYIPNDLFRGCVALKSLVLPEGLIEIGDHAFENCKSIKQISLPSRLEKIGIGSFLNCGLEELLIPDSVYKIGMDAFKGSSLRSVTLGASVESTNGGIFDNCQFLEEIIINCKENSFSRFKELNEKSKTEKIYSAFSDLENVKIIRFGDGATLCNLANFSDFPKLETVFLGKSIQTVEAGPSFSLYSPNRFLNLQSIIIDPENKYLYSGNKSICNSDNTLFAVFADGTIPETTVSISADAFLSYRGKELFVPKNVVEIKLKGEHISFADIETLTAVEVDPDNPTYYSENGKIYLKQSGELYFDPSENKNNE